MTEQKKQWVDYLKGISTIAIILLHVASPILYEYNNVSLTTWIIGDFYARAMKFAVPVFFMFSGIFLLNNNDCLSVFFKKRFLRIIPPFLFWSVIYILYSVFYLYAGDFNTVKSVVVFAFSELSRGSAYHLWFIYALIPIYLFIPIIKPWVQTAGKKELLYFLGLWCFTFFYEMPVIGDIMPRIKLIYFSGFLGYLILGYYLVRLKPVKKYLALLIYILGVLIAVWGTYYRSKNAGFFDEYFSFDLAPSTVLMAIGIFLFFKDLEIPSKLVRHILSFICKYSYGIYLIHILVLYVLRDFFEIDWRIMHPILSIPIVTLLTLGCSVGTIFLLTKIKPIAKFVN